MEVKDKKLTEEQRKYISDLYQEMYDHLVAYAVRQLRNIYLAEEAMQVVFMIACKNPKKVMASGNPRGWAKNTLKNTIRNTNKANARLRRLILKAESLGIERFVEHRPEHDVDIMYADLLPAEDYKLLTRVALEGYTIVELAKELGISYSACDKRIQRAKKKLREKLQEI